MVTFLALDLHFTLPPMVHPIVVGLSRWTGYFHPTTWEPKHLPLGKIATDSLVCVHSRCSPSKGDNSLSKPSSSWNALFGITHTLRSTQKWSNTIIHICGNIGADFPSDFSLASFWSSLLPVVPVASWPIVSFGGRTFFCGRPFAPNWIFTCLWTLVAVWDVQAGGCRWLRLFMHQMDTSMVKNPNKLYFSLMRSGHKEHKRWKCGTCGW